MAELQGETPRTYLNGVKEEGTTPSHCNEAGAELKKTKEKRLGQPQHTTAQMCGRPPPTAGSITTNTTTPLEITWVNNKVNRNQEAFLLEHLHRQSLYYDQQRRG
jgi:hypothetical protein